MNNTNYTNYMNYMFEATSPGAIITEENVEHFRAGMESKFYLLRTPDQKEQARILKEKFDEMIKRALDQRWTLEEFIKKSKAIIVNVVGEDHEESDRKKKIRSILKIKHQLNTRVDTSKMGNLFYQYQEDLCTLLRASEISKLPIWKISLEEAKTIVERKEDKSRKEAEEFLLKADCERKNRNKKKKRRRNKRKPLIITSSAKEEAVEHKHPVMVEKKINPLNERAKKAAALHKRKGYLKLKRVSRWQKGINEIRLFEDRGKKKYQDLSDEEILKQRAFHYLPEIDKVFAGKLDKKVYTFPTNRGVGMMAELKRGNEALEGRLCVGINKQNKIYHLYFEALKSDSVVNDLLNDSLAVTDEKESGENWENTSKVEFSFNEDGSIHCKFHGEEHSLVIFPIRKDLLDKKIFNI